MTDLHHSSNLLLVMDCLWFNHAVLSSEPILTPTSKPTTPPPTISQSQTSQDSESELFSTTPEEEHSDSSDSSPASPKDDSLGDDTEEVSEEGEPEYRYKRLRPTSLRTTQRRSRSHSSSPSLQSLTKTSSCKSLYELEYEEVNLPFQIFVNPLYIKQYQTMGDEEKHVLLNKDKIYSRSKSHAGDELKSFRSCLRWMCIDQSNPWRASLSYSLFFLLAILVPLLSHFILACDECDVNLHRPYDAVVQLSLTGVAIVSFLSLSTFFKRYGLRRFLYFDKLCDESEKVRQGYTAQLHRSLKILGLFVLPCFAAEGAYKVWWYSSGATQIPFFGNVYISDALACILELCSWLYRTSIFFLVCVLFRLICRLQILRLQDFAKVFQEESDVASVLAEHLRIRRHLRVISHRFRAFIVSSLMIITASQLASLLNTTRSHADLSIFRSGELALCSMTLMAGLIILLRSATKITHKAQAVTCLAAKWHICSTLDSFDATDGETPIAQITSTGRLFAIHANESEEDDAGDEDDDIDTTKLMIPIYAHSICYQKRQALVTYFENNRAGITVFGFMLDRSYLHTIFGIELSLVLWLLGKTIGFS